MTIDSTLLFRETLNQIDSTLSFQDKTYVAIPASGCTACIKPAFDFMLKNLLRDDLLFIVTEIADFRGLEKKFGMHVLGSENVRLDTNNHMTLAFYSIYPQIFIIKTNRLKKHIQIDSQSINLWDRLGKLFNSTP